MAVDTASDILAFKKQGTGNNLNTWGDELNNALDRISEAIADRTEKSLTGNYTLTSTNYVQNESRSAALVFSDGGLSATPTVTLPARKKLYWAKNTGSTYGVTLGVSGGTSVTIPTGGRWVFVLCDGTDCEIHDPSVSDLKAPTAALSMNSQKITSLADPTSAQDAATKNYIDTLASSGDLATVAGIASDITTVAGNNANITTVAGNNANVTTVAGISGNVTTVAGIASNVTTVAGISANVTTVAGDSTDIQALAAITANINTVAGISANVTTVANDGADIGTVATNIANVNTVATGITNVNTVATNIANVNTVAGDTADIGTVATNIAAVTNVSTNMADVQNASSLVSGLTAADVGAIADPGTVTDNKVPQWDGTSGGSLKDGLTVGTGANNLVQLDGTSKLPAVDGSLLTNLPASGSLTLLSTATASNDASVEFTSNIDSTYDEYEIHLLNVLPASAAGLHLTWSNNGGTSYHSSSYKYTAVRSAASESSATVNNSTSDSKVELSHNTLGAGSNGGWCGVIRLHQPSTSIRRVVVNYEGGYITGSAEPEFLKGTAMHDNTSSEIIDAVKFAMSTGNISSGEFKLYGVKKS